MFARMKLFWQVAIKIFNNKFHKLHADTSILQLIYEARATNTANVMAKHLKLFVVNTAVINMEIHHTIVTCFDGV
jgi:hypothetical protein